MAGLACGEKRGTLTGHTRHWRAGESPCAECFAAQAAYHRYWRLRKLGRHESQCVRGLGWPVRIDLPGKEE